MNANRTTCTLCQQDVSAFELQEHREQETREIVDYTLGMIKARHPEWTKGDPTCQKCWDYYKKLPAA